MAEGKQAKYVFPIGGVLNKQLLLNALADIEILQQPSACHDSLEEVAGSKYGEILANSLDSDYKMEERSSEEDRTGTDYY